MVNVTDSPSILLAGMAASRLPIAVAHGEGRAEWPSPAARAAFEAEGLVAARFVDHRGRVTERYPENPNGSPGGITALTTPDGLGGPTRTRLRRYLAAAGQGRGTVSAGNQIVVGSAQAFACRSAVRFPHLDGELSLTGLHLRSGSHEYAPQPVLSPIPSAITV